MIGQTIAIFVDAYRDLNSRKLFWITLILSTLFIALFAILGTDAQGLKILTTHVEMPAPQAQYLFKFLFQTVVIGLWLTWVATILALVSTAGIFPDLITGGSIDLYLSKPLSRGRLFITKYLAGLIFVSLQVIVVTVGGFLIMGWRGHTWLPQLFLAIPIVICFFSYLFAICVFFGVLTRSSIAALLLTIGAWALLAGLDRAEPIILTWHDVMTRQADQYDSQAREVTEAQKATTQPDAEAIASATMDTARAQSARDVAWRVSVAQRIAYGLKTVTPKTTDTTDLLTRYVFTDEEVASSIQPPGARRRIAREQSDPEFDNRPGIEGARHSAQEIRNRSVAWVIGTSLIFEAALVGLAGLMFCRRDY